MNSMTGETFPEPDRPVSEATRQWASSAAERWRSEHPEAPADDDAAPRTAADVAAWLHIPEELLRCPADASHATGRQAPEYAGHGEGIPYATGWFRCEVCGIRYVISRGHQWAPSVGQPVQFTDRGHDVEGQITGIRGDILYLRELLPDGTLGGTTYQRYATVCVPPRG